MLGLGALFVLFTYCFVWPIIKTLVNGACSPWVNKLHLHFKAKLNLLWRLLILSSKILGLAWRETTYFAQNSTTNFQPNDTRRVTSESPYAGDPFWFEIKTRRRKMFHIFYFLQSDMVFGITNPFSWIFSAFSSEKSCPTLVSFLFKKCNGFVRTVKAFSPAESWLVNSNFIRPSRMQWNRNRERII